MRSLACLLGGGHSHPKRRGDLSKGFDREIVVCVVDSLHRKRVLSVSRFDRLDVSDDLDGMVQLA
jgi:hypothetical protein